MFLCAFVVFGGSVWAATRIAADRTYRCTRVGIWNRLSEMKLFRDDGDYSRASTLRIGVADSCRRASGISTAFGDLMGMSASKLQVGMWLDGRIEVYCKITVSSRRGFRRACDSGVVDGVWQASVSLNYPQVRPIDIMVFGL